MARVIQSLQMLEAMLSMIPDNVLSSIKHVLCSGRPDLYSVTSLSRDQAMVNSLVNGSSILS